MHSVSTTPAKFRTENANFPLPLTRLLRPPSTTQALAASLLAAAVTPANALRILASAECQFFCCAHNGVDWEEVEV
ncbi:hypothetical protein CONPUDRAFT_160128 [Coniophora puteana RWD-64-598 SS2]|uniref:Uncharacterized protein n=1 Tax=Coniophora puteana (strain RWD-64-598) TaxID=741705 RepID=R7SE25_CONPW|nr:uncharacterized protein CONPUDRAFT_160128 [Coniophora puteana RWD-64-598 SS2]EIW74423.1 hypothetical protein CONPUDRAFT_160128 [Coniophora puteana RWD-64-598 SS2]